jgi:hypothetical protein
VSIERFGNGAMNNIWSKTKLALGIIVAIFAIVFVLLNWNAKADPGIHLVFKDYDRPSLLLVLLVDSVVSVIGWWLLKFVFKTLRSLSQREADAAAAKTIREQVEIISKANRLQTAPAAPAAATVATPTTTPPAPTTPPAGS